jgi:cobalt-precorrin 5A hydrolase
VSIAVITLSSEGLIVGKALAHRLPDSRLYAHCAIPACDDVESFEKIADLTASLFRSVKGMIFIAPCGVVVRSIAPHLVHKLKDPAVVVVDVAHRYAISLLSGHEGGANELAHDVSRILDSEPVITTTTDAARTIIAGIGCRKGKSSAEIIVAVHKAFDLAKTSIKDLRLIATIPQKAIEPGIIEASNTLKVPIRIIQPESILNSPHKWTESELVQRHLNLPAVAEPCALLAGRRAQLILPKIKCSGVTVALAKESCLWSESAPVDL